MVNMYRDVRRWLLKKSLVSAKEVAEEFSLSLQDGEKELKEMRAIGLVYPIEKEGIKGYYEVFASDDPLVEIHSLTSIWRRVEQEPHPESIAVLSFADDEDHFPYFPSSIPHFKVICEDVDYPSIREVSSFFADVEDAARWVDTQIKAKRKILCQCEYGVSRSAGAAAAILEKYHYDGITIFSNYDYSPNRLIYHRLLTALLPL